MNGTWLNIIMGLCGTVMGLLAFADEIGKIHFFRFFKLLPFKLIVFMVAACFGVWASIMKDRNADLLFNSINSLPEPDLILCIENGIQLDSIKNDGYYFSFRLCNEKAPSANINLEFYGLVERGQQFDPVGKASGSDFLSPPNFRMTTDSYSTFTFRFDGDEFSTMYILLNGTYSNLLGTKTFHVKTLNSFEMNTKKYVTPRSPKYEQVMASFEHIFGIK